MISVDFDIEVEDFPTKEIGYWTLVRAYEAKLKFEVTNDGGKSISGVSVRPILESYLGQEKPQLFQRYETQVIEKIPPDGKVSIEFKALPNHPGLASIALYITDSGQKAVMAKRKGKSDYQDAPLRWWLHVIDDISIDILRELKRLTRIRE